MKAGLKGALLASAVAVMFAASAMAAEKTAPAKSDGSSQAKVKCLGANDCKGKGSCATASNDCAGKNSCKGKGMLTMSSVKECTDKGGKVQAD